MHPVRSTFACQPGRMTIVVSRSSMIAGPARLWSQARSAARIDRRLDVLAGETRLAIACAVFPVLALERRHAVARRRRAGRDHAPADDLDIDFGKPEAVEPFIGLLEDFAQPRRDRACARGSLSNQAVTSFCWPK